MPRTRARRFRAAITCIVLAATAGAASSCASGGGAGPSLRGQRLEVVAAWTGAEQAHFVAVLRAFTRSTGATVRYVPAPERMPDILQRRLAAHRPPDVALLPQPGLLRRFASGGRLVPLSGSTAAEVRRSYASVWASLASWHGRLYGVWFKAADKSLLWYDVHSFERAGMAPPSRLADLRAAADRMRALGMAPFAVGGAEQWTLTDWFENLYLQLAGARRYDLLADHRLPWTDPSVTSALRSMRRLLQPADLLGGVAGTLGSGFETSVARAFAPPARAAMLVEGDFVAGVVRSATHARIGVDVDAAPFPAADPDVPLLVGGGDVAVQFRRSPAAAALLRFLARPEAAAVWARAGGFLSANQQLDLSVYPDRLTRSIARRIVEAGNNFRFDLSDLQPAAFGSTQGRGLQQALADLLRGADVGVIAARLERQAGAAWAGEPP